MYKTSQSDIVDIEILPGNIVYITARKGAEIDLSNAKRLVTHIDSILDPKDPLRGGIFDISNVTFINDEAREYLANNNDTTGITVGIAIISNSFLESIVTNIFRSLTEVEDGRIAFFESPIRAEHWLRTKMREERERLSGPDVSRQVA